MQESLQHKQLEGSNNCVQCCVAYMLDLTLSEVPNFSVNKESEGFWIHFGDFLKSHGYTPVMLPPHHSPDSYYLASGMGPRAFHHMVVMRDGKLIHDPHPSNKGINDIEYIWLLAKDKKVRDKNIKTGMITHMPNDLRYVDFVETGFKQFGNDDEILSSSIQMGIEHHQLMFSKETRIVIRSKDDPMFAKDVLVDFSDLINLFLSYPMTFELCHRVWPEEFPYPRSLTNFP